MTTTTCDVAVIGAGCFGAWTANRLRHAGQSVRLLDQYGPANARASSGGESRIIRMSYGADEIYTRFSFRSLDLWRDLFRRAGLPLFHRTGVLWLSQEENAQTLATLETLRRVGVPYERLSVSDLQQRFPQFAFEPTHWGVFEPDSGALMARRAVQAVVDEAVREGVVYQQAHLATPRARGRLASVETGTGETISAGTFVFACGPWLPKVFPEVAGDLLFPTRQEVFFFGPPRDDLRFAPPVMPSWLDFGEGFYGIPDLESRGFKLAPDEHGPAFDPDSGERLVSAEGVARVRDFLARRFPALKDAPLVEGRVCQYENTSSGDFLIDRHPEMENVWLVGGGSGHGFKHGPAVGEYVTERVLNGTAVDTRFSLATKSARQNRAVF